MYMSSKAGYTVLKTYKTQKIWRIVSQTFQIVQSKLWGWKPTLDNQLQTLVSNDRGRPRIMYKYN